MFCFVRIVSLINVDCIVLFVGTTETLRDIINMYEDEDVLVSRKRSISQKTILQLKVFLGI